MNSDEIALMMLVVKMEVLPISIPSSGVLGTLSTKSASLVE